MVGGLDSIGRLATSDLCKNSMLISSRELGRTASKRSIMIGKKIFKYSANSSPANAKFGGNIACRKTIGGQRNDIFFLSRGDGVHSELKSLETINLDYIAEIEALHVTALP